MKLVSALVISAFIATPALAGIRISWSDLDLSTTTGAQAFHGRIEDAASRACRSVRKQNSRIPDTFNCKAAFHEEALSLMPEPARVAYLGALSRLAAQRARR